MFKSNLILLPENSIEPPPGFEPVTYALRVRSSTPELRRQSNLRLERY